MTQLHPSAILPTPLPNITQPTPQPPHSKAATKRRGSAASKKDKAPGKPSLSIRRSGKARKVITKAQTGRKPRRGASTQGKRSTVRVGPKGLRIGPRRMGPRTGPRTGGPRTGARIIRPPRAPPCPEQHYVWEDIDENWRRCSRSQIWLAKKVQWLFSYDERGNVFRPLRPYQAPVKLPFFTDSRQLRVSCGAATAQGRRKTQEDRFAIVSDLAAFNAEQNSANLRQALRRPGLPKVRYNCPRLFAIVCDGHAGPLAAEFTINTLGARLGHFLSQKISGKFSFEWQRSVAMPVAAGIQTDDAETGEDIKATDTRTRAVEGRLTGEPQIFSPQLTDEKIREAMVEAFEITDREFLLENRACRDGSTATCAVVVGRTLAVGNCGDSRAILCSRVGSGWAATRVSVDHKPDLACEQARIVSRGGNVRVGPGRCARVVGGAVALAVSRAMGDRTLKRNRVVVPTPDVAVTEIDTDHHRACVLASDGVWDVLSETEVCGIVRKYHASRQPHDAAAAVVQRALRQGSSDNVTCQVIYFHSNTHQDKPPRTDSLAEILGLSLSTTTTADGGSGSPLVAQVDFDLGGDAAALHALPADLGLAHTHAHAGPVLLPDPPLRVDGPDADQPGPPGLALPPDSLDGRASSATVVDERPPVQ